MINEEKRNKFMQVAETRVNNIIHSIEIIKPMAKSPNYDYTKEDVEGMFSAIQQELELVKEEFEAKFIKQERQEKRTFSFGTKPVEPNNRENDNVESDIIDYNNEEE